MNNLTDTDAGSLSSQLLHNRFILTTVGDQQLAFPSPWVAEIMLVERSRILSLPFYGPMFLGVVHHQSDIVPLISSQVVLPEKSNQPVHHSLMKETLNIIRLGSTVGELAGVGVVVERVSGSVSEAQIATSEPSIHRFKLQDMSDQVWRPKRWPPKTDG
ncbi:MAG: chemotaxis protein CheW [Leptolyngbyaceae cyanobacterium MO_188.B28]|nr:chemotaxis protein CheW [Leptolyngbyaceae cyanobacterium MO_188.B28]